MAIADLPTLLSKIEYQENPINCEAINSAHGVWAGGVQRGVRPPLTKKKIILFIEMVLIGEF